MKLVTKAIYGILAVDGAYRLKLEHSAERRF